ncbi:hypothetical protein D3C71_1703320 [compost metagenome]
MVDQRDDPKLQLDCLSLVCAILGFMALPDQEVDTEFGQYILDKIQDSKYLFAGACASQPGSHDLPLIQRLLEFRSDIIDYHRPS